MRARKGWEGAAREAMEKEGVWGRAGRVVGRPFIHQAACHPSCVSNDGQVPGTECAAKGRGGGGGRCPGERSEK